MKPLRSTQRARSPSTRLKPFADVMDSLLLSESLFQRVVVAGGIFAALALVTDSRLVLYAQAGTLGLFALVTLLSGLYMLGVAIGSRVLDGWSASYAGRKSQHDGFPRRAARVGTTRPPDRPMGLWALTGDWRREDICPERGGGVGESN